MSNGGVCQWAEELAAPSASNNNLNAIYCGRRHSHASPLICLATVPVLRDLFTLSSSSLAPISNYKSNGGHYCLHVAPSGNRVAAAAAATGYLRGGCHFKIGCEIDNWNVIIEEMD